jgi:hypothetical protein
MLAFVAQLFVLYSQKRQGFFEKGEKWRLYDSLIVSFTRGQLLYKKIKQQKDHTRIDQRI